MPNAWKTSRTEASNLEISSVSHLDLEGRARTCGRRSSSTRRGRIHLECRYGLARPQDSVPHPCAGWARPGIIKSVLFNAKPTIQIPLARPSFRSSRSGLHHRLHHFLPLRRLVSQRQTIQPHRQRILMRLQRLLIRITNTTGPPALPNKSPILIAGAAASTGHHAPPAFNPPKTAT